LNRLKFKSKNLLIALPSLMILIVGSLWASNYFSSDEFFVEQVLNQPDVQKPNYEMSCPEQQSSLEVLKCLNGAGRKVTPKN
jgi:hypothetical protein